MAVLNITSAGQNIISLSSIYGGTYNLFAVTFKRMGIDVTFIAPDCSDEELEAIIKAAIENVRAAQNVGDQPKWIALDIGPTGKLLKPYGDLDFEDAVQIFAKTVRLRAYGGGFRVGFSPRYPINTDRLRSFSRPFPRANPLALNA